MKNYAWKELARKEHPRRNIMGTDWPDETVLEKAVGVSVYRITYHLCNGTPSGCKRFKTRYDAEMDFSQVF